MVRKARRRYALVGFDMTPQANQRRGRIHAATTFLSVVLVAVSVVIVVRTGLQDLLLAVVLGALGLHLGYMVVLGVAERRRVQRGMQQYGRAGYTVQHRDMLRDIYRAAKNYRRYADLRVDGQPVVVCEVPHLHEVYEAVLLYAGKVQDGTAAGYYILLASTSAALYVLPMAGEDDDACYRAADEFDPSRVMPSVVPLSMTVALHKLLRL